MKKMELILASASPRRRELLQEFFHLSLRPTHIDERVRRSEAPKSYVQRVAKEKWLMAARKAEEKKIILSADTIVVLKNRILGKPKNRADAQKMLKALSNQKHEVLTSVCMGYPDRSPFQFTSKTSITFRKLVKSEIDAYLRSGEWEGKAGAYGIQGKAQIFVSHLEGSLTNVIGLPLEACLRYLNIL